MKVAVGYQIARSLSCQFARSQMSMKKTSFEILTRCVCVFEMGERERERISLFPLSVKREWRDVCVCVCEMGEREREFLFFPSSLKREWVNV